MLVPQRGIQQQQQAEAAAMLYQQPQPGAYQTISRSSNLHQQHHLAMMRQQQQQTWLSAGHQDQNLQHLRQQDYFLQQASQTMGRRPRPRSTLQSVGQQRPLCKCRVIYLGSSVPHVTKNGLHGIQEPLKHLYPEEQFSSGSESGLKTNVDTTIDISHLSSGLGIDSWMSVWSNGLLLENVDELGRQVSRFFAIDSLHYCAAVRYFDTRRLAPNQRQQQQQQPPQTDANNNSQEPARAHFLPLDAPIFRLPQMLDPAHPPVFAAIMRRTSGVKVLECHAFICRRDAAANALVRCCTQSYGDLLSARRLSLELASATGCGQQRRAARAGRRPVAKAAEESAEAERPERRKPRSDDYAVIARGEQRGSSRSLFTEFAPQPERASEEAAISDEARRLSRSLDLLRVDANETCCRDQHYSVVSQRRRHSRSMHNLELGGARRRQASGRGRRRQQSAPLDQHQHQQQHRRRSASVHEIQTGNEAPAAERIYEPVNSSSSSSNKAKGRRPKQAPSSRRQASPPPPPPPLPPAPFQQPIYLPPQALYLAGPHSLHPAYHPHHHPHHQHHLGPPAYLPYYPAPYLHHQHQHQARFMRLSPPLSYLEQTAELPAKTHDEVVSGQPSFQTAASKKQQKMSWIKRLSLTMSPGSMSPSGRPAARKRTSLFAGGLTLART